MTGLAGCSSGETSIQTPKPQPRASASALFSQANKASETLTIIGTNDLHGHIEMTPVLGGFMANIRALRASDGGGVLLVDAGDMFQGTLESNMGEGMAVLRAYAALGYQAAAIGNHEFDYGPVGPAATPEKPGDDPRGALKALTGAATFPLLNANILDKTTHQRFDLPRSPAHVVLEIAGVRVGVVGVTSLDTLETTISGNVKDLEIAPLAETIEKEAHELRANDHADVVVVLAHAGGKCKTFMGDPGLDQCEMDSEIFKVARALPKGSIDAIVSGHTHQGVAHTIAGIPIIEAFSYGKSFGRVDLKLERPSATAPWHIASSVMFPPQMVCDGTLAVADPKTNARSTCTPPDYEGAKVEPDARVAAAIAPDLEKARARRAELLGVHFDEVIQRNYDHESAEGNLFADLLRKAHSDADVVMMNGGGLRADLPAGDLNYGSLYEAFPFDNKVATAKISGGDLEALLLAHFTHTGGILSVSGIRITMTCEKGELHAQVERKNGKKLKPTDKITLLASDFMMTGGDHFWGPVKAPEIVTSSEQMRDTLERELRSMKTVKSLDVFDPIKPRLVYSGTRPLHCDKKP